MTELATGDPRVTVVELSRNFGKEIALDGRARSRSRRRSRHHRCRSPGPPGTHPRTRFALAGRLRSRVCAALSEGRREPAEEMDREPLLPAHATYRPGADPQRHRRFQAHEPAGTGRPSATPRTASLHERAVRLDRVSSDRRALLPGPALRAGRPSGTTGSSGISRSRASLLSRSPPSNWRPTLDS